MEDIFEKFFSLTTCQYLLTCRYFSHGCDSKLRVKAVIILTEQLCDEVELLTLVGGPEQHHSVTAPFLPTLAASFHSHLQHRSVGGLDGTTADHKSMFVVKIIAGAVAVVLQIRQQLVFACLV